jgi:hypothetical protein
VEEEKEEEEERRRTRRRRGKRRRRRRRRTTTTTTTTTVTTTVTLTYRAKNVFFHLLQGHVEAALHVSDVSFRLLVADVVVFESDVSLAGWFRFVLAEHGVKVWHLERWHV